MRHPLLLAGGLLVALAGTVRGQNMTACDLGTKGSASSETIGNVTISRGSGGITVVCRTRNITLTADSGEMIGDDRVNLVGRVHYSEPSRIDLRSDTLTYYLREERVIVRGRVIATQPNGSRLTGPEATYLRAVPRVRTIEELTASRNPTVTIAPKAANEKPVIVNAATIYMRGDSVIFASRGVVIDRSDLVARGDSAFLDGRVGTETMRLMFKPSVEGREGRRFRLEGEIIDAYSKDRKLERVIARGKGHATSQDLDIVADTIDLRMTNDAMERAIAWSKTGLAKATAPGQTITADSIDVRMPGQKVRVVHAIRNARAEADADTIRFRSADRDWLRGDSVVAWFDSTATKDTSKTPPLQRILATHRGDSAQAYYHMPPADTACKTPAISYVRGREIRIDFDNRKVGLVSVRDSVVGMYLEPQCNAPRTAADSAKAVKPPTGQPANPPSRQPADQTGRPANPPARKPGWRRQ